MITRRTFVSSTAAALAYATLGRELHAAEPVKIRISSCGVGLKDAKLAGLEGVEIGVGDAAEKLRVAEEKVRENYKKEMQETGLVISSFMMGLLNSYPLASDPRGPAWLEQSIDAAKDLGAKVILVAFFGRGSLGNRGNIKKADVDVVVERLRAAAPRAKDAGVILGIENELTAQQNAEILDRVKSPAVQVYYDVGNLTNNGYDVPAEIRFLKERIAIFHFKDGANYLGDGKVKYPEIGAAIKEIGYNGWIVLETSNPSRDAVADTKKNAAFIKKLFWMA
ncbi:MAG: sugar phosphate isomerase/epimerase [Planctomycetota bacterium]|nr:sugar phosphate isomerase/epimerase [Planctomycetota bacterium]